MDRRDDSPDVEWLDVGPPVSPDGQRLAMPRWRWWYALVALALVALAVSALRQHNAAPKAAAHHSTPPAASSTPPAAPTVLPSTPGPVSAAPIAPVTVVSAGHSLLAVPSSWELFARGPGVVVRIQLAAGRVTTTTVPALTSTGPVAFVVGPSEAIVRPLDPVVGYVVRDNHAAQPLTAPFDQGGPLLAGPTADSVWVPSTRGDGDVLTLVGFDGRPTGQSITVPTDAYIGMADGSGYPLLTGTGGAYDARPSGEKRVTTGTVLAVGATAWLTVECDVSYHCVTTVISRTTGARHALPTPVSAYQAGSGLISPDGRTAAVLGPSREQGAMIYLLDLATGVATSTRVNVDPSDGGGSANFVWSPDSRYLFAADGNTSPAVIERATSDVSRLAITVPSISQVALRS